MTLQQFLHILRKMEPSISQVPPSAPLHSVAFLIVADRWIKNVPDDKYSIELRTELQYFVEHKRFSWQEKPVQAMDNTEGNGSCRT